MKKISLLIFIAFFIFSCNQNDSDKNQENDTSKITSETTLSLSDENQILFSDISFPEKEFEANTKEETLIEVESGTEILIPENTFVDKNGTDINDIVNVKFKEIRTASDIIFNNIDMKYDSAGVNYDFQTAGMFNIEASYKGNPVFIKKGKDIKVTFASNVEGDFNYYRYQNGNWVYQEPIKAKIEVKEVTNNSEYITLKPTKLDPKNDLIIDINSSYEHIAELKDYKKIIWKYSGDLSKQEVVSMLSGYVTDPELISSGEIGIYLYQFKKGKEKKSIKVAPVFKGRQYKKLLTQYNASVNSTQINGNNIKRTVSITQLGLMNYDIISKQADAVFVEANFYLKSNNELITSPIFHVTGEDNIIVKQFNGNQLGYSKSYKNKLVAVLPGNKIAVTNTSDFENIMANVSNNKVDFKLTVIDKAIKSPNDLEKIIAEL